MTLIDFIVTIRKIEYILDQLNFNQDLAQTNCCLLYIAFLLIFAMDKFILISVFSFFLTVDVNSQTTGWSSWTNCTETEGCFQRRIFTCGAGERLECLNETNEGFEQLAVNCSASPECFGEYYRNVLSSRGMYCIY